MNYVDGFLLPLPEGNIERYRSLASDAGNIWMEYGALAYFEGVLEDGTVDNMTPFTKSADAKEGETVVFAYIVYKSREHRDEVNKKVMADDRLSCDKDNPPFDFRRMAYGGFQGIVQY